MQVNLIIIFNIIFHTIFNIFHKMFHATKNPYLFIFLTFNLDNKAN